MKRSFDEIIVASLEDEFDNIVCPNPREELNAVKMKLKKRIQIMRMKRYASICAIFLIIPFIFLTYANTDVRTKNYSQGSPILIESSIDELVANTNLIVNGEVNKIFENKQNKYAEIEIKETFKGVPYNKNRFLVKIINIDFELEEEVLLFLSEHKSDTEKDHYIMENVQGKYTLKKDSNDTFVNSVFPKSEIKISWLRNKVNKN
jgi:hypothetical protein